MRRSLETAARTSVLVFGAALLAVFAATVYLFARSRSDLPAGRSSTAAVTKSPMSRPVLRDEPAIASQVPIEPPVESAPVVSAPSGSIQFEPGTANITNEFSRKAEAQWLGESRAPEAAMREDHVRSLFDDANVPDQLTEIECRTTMCRMDLKVNADTFRDPASHKLAGRLGKSVAVLENDGEHMVVLVPAADIPSE